MHMATQLKRWTLEEVHSLPEDGNKYELVRGDLFVTPAPTNEHETIVALLARMLDRYVEANDLGLVHQARAVMRFDGSEVEPDLMVRAIHRGPGKDWSNAPLPILIVEVLSNSTRRRDQIQKRELYRAADIPEYWMVDPDRREVRVVRHGTPDGVTREELIWSPAGTIGPLVIRVAELFGEA